MKLVVAKKVRCEVLVIGGGAAGCRAAIASADQGCSVLLTNKGPIAKSGITLTAGGGFQAPFGSEDSEELFFEDTVKYGYYLADQNLVEALARDACARVLDLESYGVRFRKLPDGRFEQRQMPGQSKPRNVLFANDGVGLMIGLKRGVQSRSSQITCWEDFFVVDLVADDGGRVAGALGVDLRSGELVLVEAGATVIATGGYEGIWEVTDCPADSTGDGVAMAYRAGAELVDLEMLLFYPSVVIWPPAAQGCFVHYEFLSPWALDGDILDARGEPVLPKPVPVRDVAMRLMFQAIEEGRGTARGGLFWDITCSPKDKDFIIRFLDRPQYHYIRSMGVDPIRERVEVAPGAHYQLGGIRIDERGATSVPGLFAVPEAAGNYEGANRLSGSALAGTQVFGAIAGREAALYARGVGRLGASRESVDEILHRVARCSQGCKPAREVFEVRKQLKKVASQYVGVKREEAGLQQGKAKFSELREQLAEVAVPLYGRFNQAFMDYLETANMLLLADLVAGSALVRKESRGHHYRVEFPERDDAGWLRHTTVRRVDGEPIYSTAPVTVTKLSLPSGV